ncbi:uncharacterized protein PHALS_03852 [Plasmopara halstedii]|uniref:Uncharacterized protein n=1 Tax=Plasmopara halstedii TaxID=4781 RepID=A0A0P1B0M4_PLAHL|nr:uncharacterized protein PHALS_03852 [Plasmopara halstedii]CEG47204.1 hypothetical protein PHALS_03852 [Plasmopara halstedii]|eukprot:XP_024583573.1 hypothetical protein PHALS_03852 [Plasmopara halstedii]
MHGVKNHYIKITVPEVHDPIMSNTSTCHTRQHQSSWIYSSERPHHRDAVCLSESRKVDISFNNCLRRSQEKPSPAEIR